jgi:hypothetical protein
VINSTIRASGAKPGSRLEFNQFEYVGLSFKQLSPINRLQTV